MKTKTIKKSAMNKPVAKKPATKKPVAKKPAAKSVTFTVHADKGRAVYLAGELKAGVYSATLKLAAGTYQYKFVIDGTWCADPENTNSLPNDQGTFNSVITVK